MKFIKKVLFLSLAIALISGCSKGPFRIYKRDLQQGNYVTQSMVNKLRANLSKSQVREIMGSPTLIPDFHQNQWLYYYLFESGDGSVNEKRALTLYFKGNALKSYSGDWNIKGMRKRK